MATLEAIEARLTAMEHDLRAIKSTVNGNGQPSLLDRSRLYADSRMEKVEEVHGKHEERASARFQELTTAVNELKVRMVIIAAMGGAGGGFLGSFFGS